MCGDDNIIM